MQRRALAYSTFAGALLLAVAPRPAADNSVNALLDARDDRAEAYAAFAETFGTDEVVVVTVEHDDMARLLEAVVAISGVLESDPTMERTISAATVYGAEIDVLTDPEMGGLSELPRLAARLDGPLNRALHLLDVKERRATLFALGKVANAEDRHPLVAKLSEARGRIEASGARVSIAGPPLLNVELDRVGKELPRTALPLLAVVALLFAIVNTRSLLLTGALIVPTALGVAGAEGLLGLWGGTTNIIVEIAKPLLFVLILASALHVAIGFIDARREGLGPHEAAVNAASKKARGVILALTTTGIGFGSQIFSPVAPIRTFGAVAACGVLLGIPLTLILLPRILAVIGGRAETPPEGWMERFSLGAVRFGMAHPRLLVLVAIAGTAAGGASMLHLETDPHAIRYFPKEHVLRTDYEALERRGLGLATVEIVVTSTSGFASRAELVRLDRVATRLRSAGDVREVVGLPLFLREAGFRMGAAEPIPEQLAIDQVLLEKAAEVDDFVAKDRRSARLSLLIPTIDADRLDVIEAAAVTAVREEMPAASVVVTGNYRLLLSAQRSLITSLWQSLLSTLFLTWIAFAIVARSALVSIAALLPNVLPTALNFAVMLAAGIHLDLGTAMTGAISLGIAVDNTLHMIVSWKHGGPDAAARSTGRAMIVTSLVISAGFLSLVSSDFGPTRNFGLLTGTAMIVALLADLCVTPAILARLVKR